MRCSVTQNSFLSFSKRLIRWGSLVQYLFYQPTAGRTDPHTTPQCRQGLTFFRIYPWLVSLSLPQPRVEPFWGPSSLPHTCFLNGNRFGPPILTLVTCYHNLALSLSFLQFPRPRLPDIPWPHPNHTQPGFQLSCH